MAVDKRNLETGWGVIDTLVADDDLLRETYGIDAASLEALFDSHGRLIPRTVINATGILLDTDLVMTTREFSGPDPRYGIFVARQNENLGAPE